MDYVPDYFAADNDRRLQNEREEEECSGCPLCGGEGYSEEDGCPACGGDLRNLKR